MNNFSRLLNVFESALEVGSSEDRKNDPDSDEYMDIYSDDNPNHEKKLKMDKDYSNRVKKHEERMSIDAKYKQRYEKYKQKNTDPRNHNRSVDDRKRKG